jgi:serine protease Do
MYSTTLSYRLVHASVASWARIAVVLCGFIVTSNAQEPAHRADGGTPVIATASPGVSARALPDFTSLVEKYGDAVVNVSVAREASETPRLPSPESPFYDFFRRFGIPEMPCAQPPVRGQASGFIVSEDGYVLTNAHVVDQAEEVTVKLPDRREFSAKVIGVDARTDVAVLKINAAKLPTVKFGDPSALRPGDWVVAIGSPFGFENSVTAGVVSATSRALGAESSIVPFIQTDVAVNPGNSGGPLFNLNGEVVGINSQIYSATGGYQGISFAIPIDVARNVQQQLVETGHVTRGRVGITIQEVNARLASSFGLDRPRGALVASVEEDGPAADAGIRPGDVILGVNAERVETSGELPSVIAAIKPGNTASLEVWRSQKAHRMQVKVGELDEPDAQRSARHNTGAGVDAPRLGVAVRPLTPEERRQAATEGTLLVEQVSGPAQIAGLQRGDIILRVNDAPVSSVAALRKATQDAEEVALLIQRDEAQIYVPVNLG